jgi:predicted secreted protein
MTIATAAAIYFIIWWLVLFAVLPWGVRSQHESGERAAGTDPGAPVIANVRRKLIWTTAIAGVVFAVWQVAYSYRLVTLDQLARWVGAPF